MDALMKFAVDNYILDGAIISMGLFGMALIMERVKALFFDYSIKVDPFMARVNQLIEADKIEEAITFCAANDKKPLPYVIKRILERSDRDDQAIEASLDIAASEIAPRLAKNLGYLSMVSNVVTLIGLLGTVVGLIMSFKAVSFADPAQKQTLLADGISLAMHATAMGLLVAIPVMVCYSFLHARQNRLFTEIDQNSSKTIELLKSRGLESFATHAYSTSGINDGKKIKMPAGPIKTA